MKLAVNLAAAAKMFVWRGSVDHRGPGPEDGVTADEGLVVA